MRSPGRPWTKKEERFLKNNWEHEPIIFIAHHLQRTEVATMQKGKHMGLPPHKKLSVWGRTAEAFLIENYRHYSNIELAKMLNEKFPYYKRSFTSVKVSSQLQSLGIKRSAGEKRITKRRNFDNGCMKGKRPSRSLPIGHISLQPTFYNSKGTRAAAYVIKISDNKWILFKHYIWELHWGPVPKGYQISCLNNDELNFRIEDLILTRKRGSIDKNRDELEDSYVFSRMIQHRKDKEELTALYKLHPEAFKSKIEAYRAKLTLNRALNGKKKNK